VFDLHHKTTITTRSSIFLPIISPKDKTQSFFHRHPDAEAKHTKFIFVGPLLDKAGAKRAAGHKFTMEKGTHDEAAGNPAVPECDWAMVCWRPLELPR